MAHSWYFTKNELDTVGPFTIPQLRDLAARGVLLPGDRVRADGDAEWVLASTLAEVFSPAPLPGLKPDQAATEEEVVEAELVLPDVPPGLAVDSSWQEAGESRGGMRALLRQVVATTAGILLLLLIALLAARLSGPDTLFVWEIGSGENRCYLMGSIHVGTDDLYPLPQAIEDAFAKSKTLVVEANLDSNGWELGQLTNKLGTYPGKEGLIEHLSKDTADQLRAYCQRKNMPLATLNRYKPWVVMSFVSLVELQALGYDPEKGLDKHFVKKARQRGMPIAELESVKSQMELFASLNDKVQEKMLLDALMEMSNAKAQMEGMMAAWKAGDLARMHDLTFSDRLKEAPQLQELYVKMFDERNIQMVAKIEKYLRGKEPVFIVVGSGHIPGEKGILKLLQAKGITARQFKRSGLP
jgi:uncharacterized protein YbaP (TraB family)